IHRPFMLENVALLFRLGLYVDDLIDVLRHPFIGQRRTVEKLGAAIDANHRNRLCLKVNVRAVELDAGAQEVDEGKLPLLDANLRLLGAVAIARISRWLDSCSALFGMRSHGAGSL